MWQTGMPCKWGIVKNCVNKRGWTSIIYFLSWLQNYQVLSVCSESCRSIFAEVSLPSLHDMLYVLWFWHVFSVLVQEFSGFFNSQTSKAFRRKACVTTELMIKRSTLESRVRSWKYFKIDVRKNFTRSVVKHWNSDAPCLSVFRRHFDNALNDMLWLVVSPEVVRHWTWPL